MAHRSRLDERVRAALDERRSRRPVGVLGVLAGAAVVLVCALPLACASAGVLSRSAAQPAEKKITGIQPPDEATALFARRLVQIGAAVDRYIPANNGHLPPELGRLLELVRPPEVGAEVAATPRERAAVFLSPTDERFVAIPTEPTPDWVNENASIEYVGQGLSPHGAAVVPDSSKAVIAHSKLNQAGPAGPFLILFLDGHVQIIGARDDAQKIITASKAAASAAFPEYLRCSSRIRSVGQAIMVYVYEDKNKMRLPVDLGETFAYMRPIPFVHQEPVPAATPKERARQYLCPIDEKRIEIPAEPSAAWVKENSSYVYLGGSDIDPTRVPDWGKTVLAHDRFDHEHSNAPVPPGKKEGRFVVLLFMDSHTEAATKADAERIIKESKRVLETARDR